MVKTATETDETLSKLKSILREGMPPIQNLPKNLRPFHQYADHLYTIDNVVMLGTRIVIPKSLQHEILLFLHAAHQGINAMCQRASDCVFWPGISIDITRIRNECVDCHRISKSYAMEPPVEISQPEYPFQKICCDYFGLNNRAYLVAVDRYSNWPIVFEQSNKAESLIQRLREIFITFGVPEELSSDGGSQFTAGITQEFLKSWGVHHRLSSVANPHSNNRAEVAVKTCKKMLMANTGPTGSLNVDAFQRAMLIYRNSIDPETKTSPAMIVFGHPTRDPIPTPLGCYCPHQTWQETMANREKALAKRHSKEREKWSEHTKALKPLEIADHVYVQNLVGNQPLRWERTGVVVEVKPFNQYVIRLDGSGRVTLRNRRHLRKFTPFVTPRGILYSQTPQQPTNTSGPSKSTTHSSDNSSSEKVNEPLVTPQQPVTPLQQAKLQQPAIPQVQPIQSEAPNDSITPAETSPPRDKKIPLALRRLLAHNKSGVKE